MPLKSRTTLKSYFETNDNPTESQYADLIDSTPNFVDDSPTYGFNWRGAYVSGTTYVKYDAVFYSVTGSSYVCILAHDVERLPTNTTYWSKIVEGGSGSGDMTAAVYDPTSVVGNAFSMANMAETADAKILTAAERTAISNNSAKLTCDATNVAAAGAAMSGGAFHDGFSDFVANEHIDWTVDQGATNIHANNIPALNYAPALGADDNYVTDAEKTKLSGIEALADVTDATNVASAGAVMNTGNETIAGIKTFSSSPIVPAPTTDLQVATKKYVDDNAGGSGDVVGPASSTDNAIARFDATTGKLLQNSVVTIDDSGVITTAANIKGALLLLEGGVYHNGTNNLFLNLINTASAVNHIAVKNNSTTNAPEVQAGGADTNVNLNLVPKGTGVVQVKGVEVTTLTGTQTLTNKTLTSPKLNEDVAVTAKATEVNVLAGIPSTLTATELGYVDGVTSAIQTQLDAKAPTASPTFTGTVTLPTGLTGVIRADSGVVSVDTDVTDIVSAASDTAAGKVELATSAEIDTSTDATRAISPDSLAGSKFGKQPFGIVVFDGATALATGDGKAYIPITPKFNGMNIVSVGASLVGAASSSGTPTIQIARGRQSSATSAYTFTDVLSTRITIDASEYHSKDATTAAVIDTSADDLATGDILRIDVDVAGTGAQGLLVFGEAQMP